MTRLWLVGKPAVNGTARGTIKNRSGSAVVLIKHPLLPCLGKALAGPRRTDSLGHRNRWNDGSRALDAYALAPCRYSRTDDRRRHRQSPRCWCRRRASLRGPAGTVMLPIISLRRLRAASFRCASRSSRAVGGPTEIQVERGCRAACPPLGRAARELRPTWCSVQR